MIFGLLLGAACYIRETIEKHENSESEEENILNAKVHVDFIDFDAIRAKWNK